MNKAVELSQPEYLAPAIGHNNPPSPIADDISFITTEAFQIWWSAQEIADLSKRSGFKVLPFSVRGVKNFIKRHDWDTVPNMSRQRVGRSGGGGTEYHFSLFPEQLIGYLQAESFKTQSKLTAKSNSALEETRKKELVTVDLTGRQRLVMDARAAILTAIEHIQIKKGQSRRKSILGFLAEFKAVDEHPLSDVVTTANDRATRTCKISRATLYNWFSMRELDGIAGLAPELTRTASDLPTWFTGFLKFYSLPQKPAAAAALRDFIVSLPDGSKAPNYDQVQRALKKMDLAYGTMARHRGREGKLTLKARMAYVIRSTEGLLPSSVYTADGQTFDAEIAHPLHGQAFRPEITSILDVATRKWVGFSVGLSENTNVIVDALRMACELFGIPAIFYTDRGSGYKNHAFDDELTGFASRLGTTKMHALPYNSQAKGLIERFNGTVLVSLAKKFPTYIGADMDRQAMQKIHKLTRKELKEDGISKTLPSWSEFLEVMANAMTIYNDSPHSSLKGASPNEAWQRHVADGFAPVAAAFWLFW